MEKMSEKVCEVLKIAALLVKPIGSTKKVKKLGKSCYVVPRAGQNC
jgi:hypothetical protein